MKASHSHMGVQDRHDQLLKERISSVEKHLSELCTALGGYTHKMAALRDKGDEVAVAAHHFADTERVNTTLKVGLENLATTLCGVGDYRDAEILRLEGRVVDRLSAYEGNCRTAREVLKSTLAARNNEMARRRYLSRLRESNPRLTQQIAHAETEWSKASVDVSRASKTLHDHVDRFERQKLRDVRAILLEFVTVELSFNTKAVELFTRAYQDVANINVEEDLKEFRQAVHFAEPTSRLGSLSKAPLKNDSRFLSKLFSTQTLFKRPEFVSRVTEPPAKLQGSSENIAGGLALSGAGDVTDRSLFGRFQISPRIDTRANQLARWILDGEARSSLQMASRTPSTNRSGDDAEDELSSATPDDCTSERLGKH